MKKLNSSGFSAVEALLVIIILAMLGFTGWFVLHAKQNTNKTLSDAGKSTSAEVSKSSMDSLKGKDGSGAGDNQQYVTVKEWGIKIAFADAGKVTYKISSNDNGTQGLELLLDPSVTSITNCQDLGIGYQRDPRAGDQGADADTKITVGGHVYTPGGSPAVCEEDNNATTGPINTLRSKIVTEFSTAKISTL